MKRLIPIARVSTKDQADNGTSLDSQIAGDLAYINKLGATALPELREDVSGVTPMLERKTGAEADALMRSGKAAGVVFYKVDRFSRDIVDALNTARAWLRAGYEIHFCDTGQLTDETDIVFLLKSWQGGQERKDIRERMTRGQWAKAKNGKVVGMGGALYGYRMSADKSTYVIYEPEAQVMRDVYTWYAVGDENGVRLKAPAIAKRLSIAGVPPPSQSNNKRRRFRAAHIWTTGYIVRALCNETYAGVWRFGVWEIHNKKRIRKRPISEQVCIEVPAIVSRELWSAAQAQRESNRKMNPRRTRHGYLLRGRVRCICGAAMSGRFVNNACKDGRMYYFCSSCANRHSGLETLCTQPHIRTHIADEVVWCYLHNLTTGDGFEASLRDAMALESGKVEDQRKRLAQVEKRIKELDKQADKLGVDLRYVRKGGVGERTLLDQLNHVDADHVAAEKDRDDLVAAMNAATLSDAQIDAMKEFRADAMAGLSNPTLTDKQAALQDFGVTAVMEGYRLHVSCVIETQEKDVSTRWLTPKTTSSA